jgi:fumarylpyruvate hydrolase
MRQLSLGIIVKVFERTKSICFKSNRIKSQQRIMSLSSSQSYAVTPPTIPSVPLVITGQNHNDTGVVFPVHRIYCVARNYMEHAIEMGDFSRDPPFFFSKPADAIVPCACNQTSDGPSSDTTTTATSSDMICIPYPSCTEDLHHEIELVVAIGKAGSHLEVASAEDHIFGYAVGVDLTRRDLQAEAKQHARPWCVAKGFDRSAPIGNIYRRVLSNANDTSTGPVVWEPPRDAVIWLDVNGERRQTGNTSQMIWTIPAMIAHLSRYFELQPGDLIFTGTPAGVGALVPGDIVRGGIEGLGELQFQIV